MDPVWVSERQKTWNFLRHTFINPEHQRQRPRESLSTLRVTVSDQILWPPCPRVFRRSFELAT